MSSFDNKKIEEDNLSLNNSIPAPGLEDTTIPPSVPSSDPSVSSSVSSDPIATTATAPLQSTTTTNDNNNDNNLKSNNEQTETKETDVNEVTNQFNSLSTQQIEQIRHIQATHAHLTSDITFNDPSLRIPENILRAITLRMGFERPSEIQRTALPIILDGHNLIAQAQSGAGKTVAFTVGMLNRIDVSKNSVQAICISPTKELADQIMKKAVIPLSSYMEGIRIESARQGEEPKGKICHSHVIIGTPGKVLNWLQRGYINKDTVKILVVDEADVMVNKESRKKGLGVDTISIRSRLPNNCQTLFFSATYADEVIDFSRQFIHRAYLIKLSTKEELVLDDIKQIWVDINKRTKSGGKIGVLQDIYKFLTIQQSIIFVNTIEEADNVSNKMRDDGFSVSTLHRNITTSRDRVMEEFRRGDSKVLVSTNALARGVDVPAVSVVVNYDLPVHPHTNSADTETYIHRIGRTGRFGKKGTAINFVQSNADVRVLKEIEREYNPSGSTPMVSEWDVNDIEGLAEFQKSEESGGLIEDNDDDAGEN